MLPCEWASLSGTHRLSRCEHRLPSASEASEANELLKPQYEAPLRQPGRGVRAAASQALPLLLLPPLTCRHAEACRYSRPSVRPRSLRAASLCASSCAQPGTELCWLKAW